MNFALVWNWISSNLRWHNTPSIIKSKEKPTDPYPFLLVNSLTAPQFILGMTECNQFIPQSLYLYQICWQLSQPLLVKIILGSTHIFLTVFIGKTIIKTFWHNFILWTCKKPKRCWDDLKNLGNNLKTDEGKLGLEGLWSLKLPWGLVCAFFCGAKINNFKNMHHNKHATLITI